MTKPAELNRSLNELKAALTHRFPRSFVGTICVGRRKSHASGADSPCHVGSNSVWNGRSWRPMPPRCRGRSTWRQVLFLPEMNVVTKSVVTKKDRPSDLPFFAFALALLLRLREYGRSRLSYPSIPCECSFRKACPRQLRLICIVPPFTMSGDHTFVWSLELRPPAAVASRVIE